MPINPVEVLQQIYGIAKQIYDQVKLAEANNAQCQELVSRVKLIEQSIKKLHHENKPTSEAYHGSLKEMYHCLEKCLECIKNFSGQHWFWKILKAGNNQTEFDKLFDQLYKTAALLNLGLSVQQIYNQKTAQKAAQKDAEVIKAKQTIITSLCEQALKGIHQIQEHQQVVLERQLVSIKLQLKRLTHQEQKISAEGSEKKSSIALLNPRWTISSFDLHFDQKIDQGTLSLIFTGRWHSQPVAIKFIPEVLTPLQQKLFIRETQILSLMNHPAIPQFFGASLEEGRACLVMEYLPLRSLTDYLQSHRLSDNEKNEIALQIANGLTYLHSQGIVHCDLKGRSVLLSQKQDGLTAKIAHFTLAYLTEDRGIDNFSTAGRVSAFCAPEISQETLKVTPAVDIFSFGSLLWQIIQGKEPSLEMKKNESDCKDIPAQYAKIILSCWQKEPLERPALADILKQLQDCRSVVPVSGYSSQNSEAIGRSAEESKDYIKARQSYEEAIKTGSIRAKTYLATLLLSDQGGPANKLRAAQLLQEAAESGHDRAIYNLGIMYCNREIPGADAKQGIKLLRKAAERGHADSMRTLAKIYETGSYGMIQDTEMAKHWRSRLQTEHRLTSAKSPKLTKLPPVALTTQTSLS